MRDRARNRRLGAEVMLAVAALALFTGDAAAQEAPARRRPPAVLLILDASGSMNAKLGRTSRIAAAKDAVRKVVTALPETSRVGLRIYGHRFKRSRARGCRDSRLVVPVRPLSRRSVLSRRLRPIRATGFTPISLSLREGKRDLPREGNRTIILVSDGVDTCRPPPPCKVAGRLAGDSLRIDVIGISVRGSGRNQLRCIARKGRGRYVSARSAPQLTQRLQRLALAATRTVDVEGRRVRAAASPDDAPVIGRGRYADRISGNEDLWYAVDLQPGKSLTSTATLIGDPIGPRSRFGLFATRIYTPALISPVEARGIAPFSGLTTTTTSAGTQRVGLGETSPSWSSAGRHYIRLTLDDADELRRKSYPVQLDVSLAGAAARPPKPEPEPRGSAAWMWTALAALVGFVLGAAATRIVRAVIDR